MSGLPRNAASNIRAGIEPHLWITFFCDPLWHIEGTLLVLNGLCNECGVLQSNEPQLSRPATSLGILSKGIAIPPAVLISVDVFAISLRVYQAVAIIMSGLLERIGGSLRTLDNIALGFIVITTVIIALRLWTRGRIVRKLEWDDYAIVISYMLFITISSMALRVTGMVKDGLIRGAIDFEYMNKLLRACKALYITVMLFLKISLGIFFLRIFVAHRPQRLLIWFFVITTCVWSIAYCMFTILSCSTVKTYFPVTAKCADWTVYSIFGQAWSWYNAITDLAFSFTAVHALWIANFRIRTKVYASAILIIGTAGGIVSLARILVITRVIQIADATGERQAAIDDPFSLGLQFGYLSLLESGIGITAASLACLRPLLEVFKTRLAPIYAGEAEMTIIDPITFGKVDMGHGGVAMRIASDFNGQP